MLGAFVAWADSGASLGVWGLWALAEALALAQIMVLWGLAAQHFDSRQARRVYPRLGAARVIGGAVGGLVAVGLPVLAGVSGIVIAWCLASWAAWPLLGPLTGGDAQAGGQP